MIRKLTESECRYAMEYGDFDTSVTGSPAAAVILTQSWCPQWAAVKNYLEAAAKQQPAINICYVEYDIEPWNELDNEEFMFFKENTFKNREIPYIRYYKNGVFSGGSNYVPLAAFLQRLGAA